MSGHARYLVIVPRTAPETFAYLMDSFRAVPDVEVVVDRRQPAGPLSPEARERRAGERARHVEAFGCTLVRKAPASEPVGLASQLRLRTLPLLREG
jgi:hypothetical protein